MSADLIKALEDTLARPTCEFLRIDRKAAVELLALLKPQAREDAQPVAIGRNIRFTMSGEYGNAVVSPGETEGMYWTFIGQGSDDEQNAVVAEIARRLNTHPAPDALRVAVEAIRAEINAPLTGPTHGAWDRGRIAGLKEALATLQAEQKGGAA